MRIAAFGILLTLALRSFVAGQTGPTPAPAQGSTSAADAKALLAEGIKLHDRGDFAAAIGKYQEALALDPNNPGVLFELGLSQYANHELPKAEATAVRLLAIPGAPRDAWGLLGNIQDDLGQPAKAIESYGRGIEANPGSHLMYFNLGTTYRRLQRYAPARACLENSAALAPGHASSHLYLGRNYMQEGYRVPAILALTRFLFLEGTTKRSSDAIGWLDQIFIAGVQQDSKTKTSITIDPDAAKDEGDFTAADLIVHMAQASQSLTRKAAGERQGPPELDRLATVLAVVGEGVEDDTSASRGFASEYYVPFLAELSRRHLSAAYAALALKSNTTPEYEAWVAAHRGEMNDVLKLASSYRWPAIRVPLPAAEGPITPAPAPARTPVR